MNERITPIADTIYRLNVEQDKDSGNPRLEWENMTGFIRTRGNWRFTDVPPVHDDKIRLDVAAETLDKDDVVRWAKIFHNMHVEYDSYYGGFWFVDMDEFRGNWPNLEGAEALARQALVIKSDQEAYNQWASGDVYGVILEKLTLWGRLSDDGGELEQGDGTVRETWEPVESVWGCYLNEDYTPEQVAVENFSMPDDVEAALRASITS